MTTGVWPRQVKGGATALSRARTIAEALYKCRDAEDPAAALAAVGAMAERFGETWLGAGAPVDTYEGGIMSADQVAVRAGVKVGTVYVWTSRGLVDETGARVKLERIPGGYDPADVDAFLELRDRVEGDGERSGRDTRG